MIDGVVLRPEAAAELQEAHGWYESRRPGLGEELLSCVEAALAQVRRSPEMFPCVHGAVRRTLVRRFPYGVFYLVEPDRVVVLAIFHGHRDPSKWMSRG